MRVSADLTPFIANPGVVARFWRLVDTRGEDECWPWKASCYREGYGRFWLAGNCRCTASRFALAAKLGRSFPTDEFACHTCDNPLCCNPEHLFVGTARINNGDMAAKGRAAHITGESNGQAKITAEDAIAIRGLAGRLKNKEIAALFSIGASQVGRIIRGEKWNHLAAPAVPPTASVAGDNALATEGGQ